MAYVTCGSEGACEHSAQGRPLCHKHYMRQRRLTLGDSSTLERRFWSKVDRTGSAEGCWLWTANTDARGYGQFETNKAHRVAYQLAVGPIPDGLQIDHLCMVTRCVNPAHLEPVTNAEKARRAAVARTHCLRGHEFTPENIYRTPSRPDVRQCRTCARLHGADHWRRKNAPHLVGQEVGVPKTHCVHGHEFTEENTQLYTARNGRSRRVCRACAKERFRQYLARKGVA